jgi:hypothetical protein
MALIKCPDCSSDISDQAVTCPHCGRPFRVSVIERTGKIWKLVALAGAVLVLIGLWGIAQMVTRGGGSLSNLNVMASSISTRVALVGIGVLLVGRTGVWWNNG